MGLKGPSDDVLSTGVSCEKETKQWEEMTTRVDMLMKALRFNIFLEQILT